MSMYFTKEHEWVKIDGTQATVGISEHAAHELGDITFVELPQMGKVVKQFDTLAGIESVKAASDIYAPVSGKITAVNVALLGDPALVNKDCHGAGWLIRIAPTAPAEWDGLLDPDAYEKEIGKE